MSTPLPPDLVAGFASSEAPTFVIGDQAAILYGNAAAGALLGVDPEAVVGHALDLPCSPYEEREIEMICAEGAIRRIRIVTRTLSWDDRSAFHVELHPVPETLPAAAPEAEAAPVPAEKPPAEAPPAAEAPAAAPAPAEPAAPAPDPDLPPPKRILILEDDLSIGDIQCRMLKTLGYATVWTKLGEETIERCKEAMEKNEPFSASLLDLTIHGGMGGREVVRHLAALDPQLRNIACSGYSDDDLNRELLKEGFVDILPKPFRAQELGKILKKNLA